MQKAVNAEAKVSLRSSTIVWDLDICCPRSHRHSNSTISNMQIQWTTAKDFHPEEPRVKETRPTLSRVEASKPSKWARKKKKKKRH